MTFRSASIFGSSMISSPWVSIMKIGRLDDSRVWATLNSETTVTAAPRKKNSRKRIHKFTLKMEWIQGGIECGETIAIRQPHGETSVKFLGVGLFRRKAAEKGSPLRVARLF